MSAARSPGIRELAASIEHAPIALVDLSLKLRNAEGVARFALDDLTNSRAQFVAKVRRLDELAEKMTEVREMIRAGRTSLAEALLADLITVARLEGSP